MSEPALKIQRGTQEDQARFLSARLAAENDEEALAVANLSRSQLEHWRERYPEFRDLHDKVMWSHVEQARQVARQRLGVVMEKLYDTIVNPPHWQALLKAIELWMRSAGALDGANRPAQDITRTRIQGGLVVNVITNAERPYPTAAIAQAKIIEGQYETKN